MNFSSSEIATEFFIPEGVTIHKASYLKASKSKKLPRAEVTYSCGAGQKIKKQKMLTVDANCDEFRAAVADIIISLQPKPLETAHTENVQNEVTGPRIHLRSRSHSFSVPSKKVKTNPYTHGGARAGAGRKSKGSKTKSLQLRSKRFQKKKSATV